MRVGLIDVDGHNFPNLPLMKLSAWHKANGDSVEMYDPMFSGHMDIVYMSKVFNFTPDYAYNIDADTVAAGGTGYNLQNKLRVDVEHTYPDYTLYGIKDEAYGFMTRGCPRNCGFCLVGKKEGLQSVKVADLYEFWDCQKSIKLLDPNLLACKEREDLIEQLVASNAWVDFTQGLDARMITDKTAILLSKVKTKMVHFAWDNIGDEKPILEGLAKYKAATNINPRKTGVYILTNYNSTHEQDLYRAEKVKEAGYWPYIMIYDKATAPRITKQLQRWCNNRFIYAKCTFEGYLKGI